MSSTSSHDAALVLDTSSVPLDHAAANTGFHLGSLRWWAIGRLIVIGTVFGLITKYHLIKVWKRYNAKKGAYLRTNTPCSQLI